MKSQENTFDGVGASHSELLTRRQAAAYLGVAEQTLAVWKCHARYFLPCVKIGRIVRYRKVDLDNFIARHMHGTEQPRFSQ
ncbi:MAG TPA: DNA-binding protein [Candidatus Melainabacteria bacterium]|nr:DNA-binding protein [Candidatus Melainabacteria bacterium]HIN64835.1 DNA-binding protein [Candidatus Obscuribacterales bacterium]